MTVKDIKQINNLPAARSATGLRRSAESQGAEEADAIASSRPTDRISTTERVQVQAAIDRARAAASDARAARLADIEAAVRKGEYRPDPARIAQRILDEAELLARIHVMLRR